MYTREMTHLFTAKKRRSFLCVCSLTFIFWCGACGNGDSADAGHQDADRLDGDRTDVEGFDADGDSERGDGDDGSLRYEISNNRTTLVLGGDGRVVSLLYNEEDVLDESLHISLSSLTLESGEEHSAIGFVPLGDDRFRLDYGSSDVSAIIRIAPSSTTSPLTCRSSNSRRASQYARFGLWSSQRASSPAWGAQRLGRSSAGDDELFLLSLPLSPEHPLPCLSGRLSVRGEMDGSVSICRRGSAHEPQRSVPRVSGATRSRRRVAFRRGRWGLASKIPAIGGNPICSSKSKVETLRPSHIKGCNRIEMTCIFELAKRGRFAQMLANEPLSRGTYGQPRESDGFESRDALVAELRRFKNAGIDVGLHGMLDMSRTLIPCFKTSITSSRSPSHRFQRA